VPRGFGVASWQSGRGAVQVSLNRVACRVMRTLLAVCSYAPSMVLCCVVLCCVVLLFCVPASGPTLEDETELASGSTDGTIKLWRRVRVRRSG